MHSFNRFARSDIGEQIQLLPQSHVQRPEALADGGFKRPFKSILVFPDSFNGLVRDQVAFFSLPFGMDLVSFKLYGYVEGSEDIFDASCDFGANSIAGEQDDLLFACVDAAEVFSKPEHEVDLY